MPLSATVLHRLPKGAAGLYSSATVVPLVAAAPSGPEPPAMPETGRKAQPCVVHAASDVILPQRGLACPAAQARAMAGGVR